MIFKDSFLPSPLPADSLRTPPGTMIVSLTTPQGSGATEQSSLRTVPSSISTVTQRDIGRDLNRMADEIRNDIRTYDHARGLEHDYLADIVRALRDELQHLADYLHRTPPMTPATPAAVHRVSPIAVTPHLPPRIQLVDQPAGDSVVPSPSLPNIVEVAEAQTFLSWPLEP